ncbi:hypothetical protein [Neisseria animalis]|uniref:Uncharacterized protein n=1 Tax=Neisseria animalis TaxID=492 RepID=A0A5P3MSQ1_NEIAN|nr:hypothetical protein [Neisseria animalis]QEY24604.1 hypothetical protein D0T90_09110 [Neisseria animalis]ROW32983.1 hypothetical protein CGZ60_01615 [Neisseria animalis]VEE07461.1 Uncharacterised protein [Neisseria animalis]
MEQLIGLALLLCVTAGVCSKLIQNRPSAKTASLPEDWQQQLQAAYRQGFADGIKHAKTIPHGKIS